MFRTLESASGELPPRPMRKGTRSCAECRRRKIRCIFESPDHAICKNCETKVLVCAEQRRGSAQAVKARTELGLQERVAKLESLLEVSMLPDNGSPSPHRATPGLAYKRQHAPRVSSDQTTQKLPFPNHLDTQASPDSFESGTPDNTDPITSLFDNAIWQRSKEGDAPQIKHGAAQTTVSNFSQKVLLKRSSSRLALLAGLPSPELLSDVLNASCSWWQTWKPLGNCASHNVTETLQEFVLRALYSDNPPSVGLALLCIAVSIQQLDHATNSHLIHKLNGSPGELYQEYFDRVDRIIVNDSDYALSIAGIEVIMMSSKLMMNLGVIKRCWILCRKAISYAQLLGMHRPQCSYPVDPDIERERRHKIWMSLCHQDAYLSLVLGLPYGFYEKAVPATIQEPDTVSSFPHELLKLSIRVVDRNQMGLNLSQEITNDIQRDLDSVAGTMPQEFWDSRLALDKGSLAKDKYLDWITAQFWYHQIGVSVQMPLMIQSAENPQLENHRASCLESSRGLLKVYHIMRSDSNWAFRMMSILDYQAFICSALLILGMLGYGQSHSIALAKNEHKDRELVQSTLDALRQAANLSTDTATASQAFQGLEALTLLSSGDGCTGPENLHKGIKPYVKVIVPYSGTITISPSEMMNDCIRTPKSADTRAAPTFTFLDYGRAQHFSKEGAPGADNTAHDHGIHYNVEESQFPPIDFDWDGVMNMNFDESWAWLSDLNTAM